MQRATEISEQRISAHRQFVDNLWAQGYDSVYIELQLLEKNVDRETIDSLLKEYDRKEKSAKRHKAVKFIVGGLATTLVGAFFTWITFDSQFPIYYILWGMMAAGMLTFGKGVVDFLMPCCWDGLLEIRSFTRVLLRMFFTRQQPKRQK